jgi:uncharacterized membrane protein
MKTPASIAGHPVHPMLVPIAIGCFVFSFAADLIGLKTGNVNLWAPLAYYTMLGGIAGALVAAVPGIIDLMSLPPGSTRSVALVHMSINLLVVAIYACNAWMRHVNTNDTQVPFMLSVLTICLLLVSGWLGGKLVFQRGVGVEPPSPL